MRALIFILLSLFVVQTANAADNSDAILNKVILKLGAEQWVDSKTAVVTLSINASVNDNGLEKLQETVLKKLNQISDQGNWHILSMDRSLDQSGLEKVQMTAEVRLGSSALVGLRDKTKAISKPGETFTLESIRFTPNEDEIRAANTTLRSQVYQQAKDELVRLNKLFPDQKYYVHNVDFVGNITPVPMPQNAYVQTMKAASASAADLSVGDKLVLSATIVLAAMPDHSLIKNIT